MRNLIIALMLASLHCYAGDTVGNGSGLAQKNVVMAYSNLSRYIETCLNSQNCKVNGAQKKLLIRILSALPSERPVEFKSGKENPGFFVIGGEVKIAKTGSSVGDVIYVNTDMIQSTDFDGSTQVLSVPDAAGLLVHEMGHHHGLHDEVQLDLLGSKVQNAVSGNTQRVESRFLVSYVVGHATNFRSREALAHVWITDGDSVEDVSRLVNSTINCPGGARKTGSHISNIHWGVAHQQGPGRWTFRLRGYFVMYCDIPNPIAWAARNGQGIGIDADFKWDGRRFQFVPGTARIGFSFP